MIRILEAFGEPLAHGGQESYVMSQLSCMDKEGLHIDFLTPYGVENDSILASVASWGGDVYHLDLSFHPGKSREYLSRPLAAFFKDRTYDIVHIHSGSTSVFAIMACAAKQAGNPRVIAHAHAAPSCMTLKNMVVRLVGGLRMSRYVDVYCACSRPAGESKFLPSVHSEIRVLHNGIDCSRLVFSPEGRSEIRGELGIADDEVVVGNVGRLVDSKNQGFLIEAFGLFRRDCRRSRLLIVGDGPDRAKLVRRAAELGLSEREVILVGNRDDIPNLLSAMDVFCFPSKFEGFGLAVLEAEANGLPCIMSPAIPRDVVIDGCTVKVGEDSWSPESWAKSLLSLVGCRRFSGAEHVRAAGFDVHQTSQDLLALYHEAVA